MSTAESVARSQAELLESVRPLLDERTLDILRRRERGAIMTRRGWLVRRMLALADVFGLTVAFVFSLLMFAGEGQSNTAERRDGDPDLPPDRAAVARRCSSLRPLRQRRGANRSLDRRRPGRRLPSRHGGQLVRSSSPPRCPGSPIRALQRLIAFWLSRSSCSSRARVLSPARLPANGRLSPEHGHRRGGRRRPARRPQVRQAPRVRHQRARLRRRRPEETATTGSESRRARARRTELPEIVRALDVERVIVAFTNDSHEETLDLIRIVKELGVQIDIVPRLFEVIGTNVGIHTAEGLPLIGLPSLRLSRSALLLKRMLDLASRSWPDTARAALRRDRCLHQARLSRSGVLPAGASRRRRDGCSGSSSSGRCRRRRAAQGRASHP